MIDSFDALWPQQDAATWSRLVKDHDLIADRCARLADVAGRPVADSAAALTLLLELAVLLADHLGVEDEVVDLTETALAAGRSAGEAGAMRARLETLRSDWAVFVGKWTSQGIADGWVTFGRETKLMMERLSQQIGAENDLLYSPALGHSVIRLGAKRIQ
ncbi:MULTISPECIES: hemerythrin domain-containing protein [unclassified Sphingomonas]|jgi:hypothetical protein|uniref:hemerythrin domain-containing protein n=1 Tax=unclassified Sphingomonas TaxID=196159 RepID=UPI002269D438|nr:MULTISPECIES: hemerythrin domain-containing protein [unclassified Sphingomonas]